MKNMSDFTHGFTNGSYLHGAILKTLHGFQEEPSSQEICNLFFKMFKIISSKWFTWNSPDQCAELIQK